MFLSTIAKDHTHVQQKQSSFASTVVVSTQQFVAASGDTTAVVFTPPVSYTNGVLLDAQAVTAASHTWCALVLLDA